MSDQTDEPLGRSQIDCPKRTQANAGLDQQEPGDVFDTGVLVLGEVIEDRLA